MQPTKHPRLLQHIARSIGMALLMALFTACSSGDNVGADAPLPEAVAGTLTYTERTALTPDAVVEVELADVSADGAAEIVSLQRISNPGQLPVHFRLEYSPERIDDSRRYTVQARIREGARIVFATDTAYPVITGGNPRVVEIAMISVGDSPAAPASEPPIAGTLTSGGVTASYTARFEDDKLISIQEERDAGPTGKAGAEYQFKEGRLLRYVELGRRSTGSGTLQEVELDFVFDDTGELLAATKTEGSSGVRPETAEIDSVRNRAELLRNHALALKASREHAR